MFQPNQPFPFRCSSYQDFSNTVQIIERLNDMNSSCLIEYMFVSGSKDPDEPGPRFLDIYCPSPGKLSHFLEEVASLDRFLKKNNPKQPSQKLRKNQEQKGSLFQPGEKVELDNGGLEQLGLALDNMCLYKINPETGAPEKTSVEGFLDELSKHAEKEVYEAYLENYYKHKDKDEEDNL